MRRVITKELRVTNGYRVIMGYDKTGRTRRWWAHEMSPFGRLNDQRVVFAPSQAVAESLFWDFYQETREVWYELILPERELEVMAMRCGLCGERVAPSDGRDHLMGHNPGAVHLTGTEVAEFFDDEGGEGSEAHG